MTAAPVVLITGAAGGIGRAVARRYAAAGARLALLDVNADGLQVLARELDGGAEGRRVAAWTCDITDPDACRTTVEEVLERFGGIDVLVNNAGMTHLSFVEETDPAVVRRVMDVNFFGAVHVTRAGLPSLLQRRGRVVVLSSVAGFAPLSGRSGYAASKYALHGFFESLRGEVAEAGVSVTLVCPSFTRTGIGEGALGGDGGPARAPRTETGRILEPEEVAEVLYRGATARRRLVLVGATSRLAYWVRRLAPRVYEWLMVRRLMREQRAGRVRPPLR